MLLAYIHAGYIWIYLVCESVLDYLQDNVIIYPLFHIWLYKYSTVLYSIGEIFLMKNMFIFVDFL